MGAVVLRAFCVVGSIVEDRSSYAMGSCEMPAEAGNM